LIRTKVLKSYILLLFFGIVPSLTVGFLDASSMALGLVTVLFLVLVFYINKLFFFKNISLFLFLFLFVVLIHSALLHVQFLLFDVKSYLSFFLLFFVLSMAFFVSKLIMFDDFDVDKSAAYVFWTLSFFAILALLTNFKIGGFFNGYNSRSIFPFGEPSHFALFFGPFVVLFIFQLSTVFGKLLLVFCVIFLSLLMESATLLIYGFLALLLFLRISVAGVLLVVPGLIFGVYIILSDPYFSSRFILSLSSDNLTALVYLQGLTEAYNALMSTSGLGLGFQMLGTQPPSEVALKIQAIMGQGPDGSGLNRKDGGFVAAKLVAEFGVLGLILLAFYLKLFVNVFIKLRKLVRLSHSVSPAYVFGLVFIYVTFVELFVRGVGYFSPSLFLFFVALFIYSFNRRRVGYFAYNRG